MNNEFVILFDVSWKLANEYGDKLIDSDGDVLISAEMQNVGVWFSNSGQLIDSDDYILIDSDGDILGFIEDQNVMTLTLNT